MKNTAQVGLGSSTLLPSIVSTHSEERILELLEQTLAGNSISAVFVEPLQGSSGGHIASPAVFRSAGALCAAHGSMLVVDEIFSGF